MRIDHFGASCQDPSQDAHRLDREVNVYSFALKPEEHQPSEHLTSQELTLLTSSLIPLLETQGAINVYAVNYNVLRVMGEKVHTLTKSLIFLVFSLYFYLN